MKTVTLDKVASVTRSCQLKREVRLTADIPCEEGVVVAVRVPFEQRPGRHREGADNGRRSKLSVQRHNLTAYSLSERDRPR